MKSSECRGTDPAETLLSLHSSLQTIPGFCVLLHPTVLFGVTLIFFVSIISTLADPASPFPAGSRKLEIGFQNWVLKAKASRTAPSLHFYVPKRGLE